MDLEGLDMACSFEILLPGIPAISTRGALGWCTVALIEQGDKKILFDTGSYNVRPLLLEELKKRGLSPEDIDLVFISHVHYDHIVNADLFAASELLISEKDLEYAMEGGYLEAGDHYVPVGVIGLLKDRLRTMVEGEYVSEGVKALLLPGHTPGNMELLLEEEGVLFAGDGVKNAWEFVHAVPPAPVYSKAAALETYKRVRSYGEIVYPGHDRPFRLLDNGKVQYEDDWSADITIYDNPYQGARIMNLL